jgi:hypothetical protein
VDGIGDGKIIGDGNPLSLLFLKGLSFIWASVHVVDSIIFPLPDGTMEPNSLGCVLVPEGARRNLQFIYLHLISLSTGGKFEGLGQILAQ